MLNIALVVVYIIGVITTVVVIYAREGTLDSFERVCAFVFGMCWPVLIILLPVYIVTGIAKWIAKIGGWID
jgi:hypothetical protein